MKGKRKIAIIVLTSLLAIGGPAAVAHQGNQNQRGNVQYECSTHLDAHLRRLSGVEDGRIPTEVQFRLEVDVKLQIESILRDILYLTRVEKAIHRIQSCIRAIRESSGLD